MKPPFETFMAEALNQAQAASGRGEVPVGAVLVRKGEVIAADGNRVRELNDPTAHAEMLAIRAGARALKSDRLAGCDLYVTLEPCPMCAAAMAFARIRRLYFGADDEKMGGVKHGPRVFASPSCHHAPEVIEGVGAAPAGKLMQDFFKGRR